jgi:hypothetical protein
MGWESCDLETLDRIAAALEAIAERQPVWQFQGPSLHVRACIQCGRIQEFCWPPSGDTAATVMPGRRWMDVDGSGPGCPRCQGAK